ncbi:MAG: rubrerythrin family protein [Nitrospirae bacterium]|nr:rubrerythrin family protein [Nitrospirota bacterium]
MELINVNNLGVCRGTQMEEAVAANFKGETSEVGLYMAMARQAQREGFPEVAEAMLRIALEEAAHAARFAELNGMVSPSTRENIERMLAGEVGANRGKRAAAVKAKELNMDEAHDAFDESSRDEARHAMMLKGLLGRFFKEDVRN